MGLLLCITWYLIWSHFAVIQSSSPSSTYSHSPSIFFTRGLATSNEGIDASPRLQARALARSPCRTLSAAALLTHPLTETVFRLSSTVVLSCGRAVVRASGSCQRTTNDESGGGSRVAEERVHKTPLSFMNSVWKPVIIHDVNRI